MMRGEERPVLRYQERVQIAFSNIFRKFLRDDPAWVESVDELLPKNTIFRKVDDTRDVVEIPSVARLVESLPNELNATPQFLFRLYRDLPSPGVAYLSKASRGTLLRRFGGPANRRLVDARRYLALVDDMISADLAMSRSMWSTAISMAGRSNSGKVSKWRLIRAIGLWQQMEHVAGIKADDVVFNILFDIAIKSNNFIVADRLEGEMEKRDIRFSREGLVSKIYSYGMKGDVEGIRETFDIFVKSGELVDTVVLNCMLASSLRAGDRGTAEEIYAKMIDAQQAVLSNNPEKSRFLDNTAALSSDLGFYRRETREIGRFLKSSKKLKKRRPAIHRALQNSLPMTPDTRTFYILLQHCARVSGNFTMFMNVLRDMETTFAVPPRHMIYILLFEAFALHGRHKKRFWTAERLRLTWMAFIRALRESSIRVRDVHSETPAVWENPFGPVGVDIEAPVDDTSNSTPGNDKGLYISFSSTSDSGEKVEAREDAIGTPEAPVDGKSNFTLGKNEELYMSFPPTSNPGEKVKAYEDALGILVNHDSHLEMNSQATLENATEKVKRQVEDHANLAEENEIEIAEKLSAIEEEEIIEQASVIENESENQTWGYENDQTSEYDWVMDTLPASEESPAVEGALNQPDNHFKLNQSENRLQDGVFLGPRMITMILRAFGTCYGPHEVMEVWLQLEELWPPSKRKANDLLGIKEVLDEQMARGPPPWSVKYGEDHTQG
ncbi:hypothetical protein N7495_000452 [Penicillium taxi]|uniref:uncharacterized protein n=1 Tax=Penicillium taxi TaxID=168475 RepID=UPI002545AA94|nr:uncharacterized protein N7495_000452 [Penicillium taxi]KAJ5907770.1 hypothetical protein N7495_000452 [Penicillium taxi]